ncbi:M3 family oligoendopeptidase [Halocola ammonii]
MSTEVTTSQPRKPRIFLPENLKIDSWDDLEPYFVDLKERPIKSKEDLKKWLLDLSELESVLEENAAWRYIRMSIDTTDEEKEKDYQFFVREIQPKIAPYSNELNRKLVDCPYTDELPKDKGYFIYLRKIEKEIELFREVNIPLLSEVREKAQEFGKVAGNLTIELDGKKLTMPRAGAELQKTDRDHRKLVYEKVQDARAAVREDLDRIFTDLVKLRSQIAKNADYKNYRDYKFDDLGRFDYTPEDCFDFHESIRTAVKPVVETFAKERKEQLQLDTLKPYDMAVDPTGKGPLKPFETAEELVEKSIAVFNKVDPYFGECLRTMDELGYLDLESKDGKSPGGFNYPLYEVGVPFIFMNAVGTPRDMVTMMHEGGHAVHSFLSRDLQLAAFKNCPSEVAELASMAMELLTMDHWDIFYSNPEDLRRAKKEQLQDVLSALPWIAIIDKFQHWIYENPNHTEEQRTQAWLRIEDELGSDLVDWSGYEKAKKIAWQKQLHLFEVPFYYIEYGMAQLGAIAVWRNYKQDPKKALTDYKKALSLGYTKTIGEIYETAGIKFDFSPEYVSELASFIKEELEKL